MALPKPIQRVADIAKDLLGIKGAAGLEGHVEIATPASPGEISQTPMAPEGSAPIGAPFSQGQNTGITPRRWKGKTLTPFEQLRALAEFDLVRIAINDVKQQIKGMAWSIQPGDDFKDDADAPDMKAKLERARLFVKNPDPVNGYIWRQWLDRAVEEILVTDALSVTPRRTLSGEPVGLQQIDGATIMIYSSEEGTVPIPPEHAYGQIIDGILQRLFTREELWYLPTEPKVYTPYGRSKVEQVILTVNTAMRWQMFDLAYFTDGTIPDSLVSVPETWTPDQIKDFQTMWDDLLSGSDERRSGGVRFIPGGQGSAYHATKVREWKYEYGEWLSRVIAWSFGVSPAPMAKMTNRATAETLQQSSLETGPRPVAEMIKTVLDRYIHTELESPELDFVWAEDETERPEIMIARHTAYVPAGIMSRDEAREEAGLEPLGIPLATTSPDGTLIFMDDQVKAKEESEKEEAQGINPSLIQRAFLEIPIITRDELRSTLGLPAVGGEDGAEYVTISSNVNAANTGETPTNPFAPSNGDEDGKPANPFEPAEEEEDEPEEEEEEEEEETEKAWAAYQAKQIGELQKWRRMAVKRAKHGKAMRPFHSTVLPPGLKANVTGLISKAADGIALGQVFDQAITHVAKQELPLPKEAQRVEQKIESLIAKWLVQILPEVTAQATDDLKDALGDEA